MRCSVIGSGVVRLPSPGASVVCSPSVPMLAARLPNAAQSWRVNTATELLPLVPVTAATVAGCGP